MAKGFKCGSEHLGTKLSMELLWENASPTSSFKEQTIPLDLTTYDAAQIFARQDTTASTESSVIIKKGKGGRIALVATNRQTRQFAFTDTGIWVGAGFFGKYNEAVSEDNTACIPVTIYGIKGVST